MLRTLISPFRCLANSVVKRKLALASLQSGIRTASEITVRPRPVYRTRLATSLAMIASDLFPQATAAAVHARINGATVTFLVADDDTAHSFANELRQLPSA